AAVVLQHLAVGLVGDEDRGGAVDGARLAPALGVEGVGHGVAGAAGRDQAVLGVVAPGVGAVGGEVAVGVVGGRDDADGGVLVERVGGVGGGGDGGIVDPAAVV